MAFDLKAYIWDKEHRTFLSVLSDMVNPNIYDVAHDGNLCLETNGLRWDYSEVIPSQIIDLVGFDIDSVTLLQRLSYDSALEVTELTDNLEQWLDSPSLIEYMQSTLNNLPSYINVSSLANSWYDILTKEMTAIYDMLVYSDADLMLLHQLRNLIVASRLLIDLL